MDYKQSNEGGDKEAWHYVVAGVDNPITLNTLDLPRGDFDLDILDFHWVVNAADVVSNNFTTAGYVPLLLYNDNVVGYTDNLGNKNNIVASFHLNSIVFDTTNQPRPIYTLSPQGEPSWPCGTIPNPITFTILNPGLPGNSALGSPAVFTSPYVIKLCFYKRPDMNKSYF